MDKLIRAFLVSATATAAAALILQQLDERPAAEDVPQEGIQEVDADSLGTEQRDAMLAELEAQL